MANAQFGDAIPEHIPPSMIYDFDFVADPLLSPDPHQGLLQLNQKTPGIFYSPRYGGHWIVRSYEDVINLAHDTELFSSNLGNGPQLLPISIDPPQHSAYRQVMLQAFSPKNVETMLPMIAQMTSDYIAKVEQRGSCEFVSEVSEPLPVIIFMNMLGLPLEYMAELRRSIIEVLAEGDANRRQTLFNAQLDILNLVIEARQNERQDDMISRLIDSDLGGRQPSFDEIQRYLLLLTNAGLDTVVNAMSFSILHLAQDLPLQAQLRNNPEQIPAAIEEFLRRYAVSTVLRRVAKDTEYKGIHFRRGDQIFLLYPAANLDASVFPEPEQFIMKRDRPPVTFGTGIHRCLGSHLARFELRTLLTQWLARIPEFHLDPNNPPTRHAGLVYTVDQLPLLWG